MAVGILKSLNRLLPFATPDTPLIQDLVHLAALCLLLYLAPQIQQRLQIRHNQTERTQAETAGVLDAQASNGAQIAVDQEHPDHNQQLINDQVHENVDEEPFDDVQPEANAFIEEGQPGPARAAAAGANRNVGAKKAKSLARKDQRRAYHEFQRSQGDMQRAQDAEGAAEREAALAVEKERRKAAEAALDAKKASEREKRKGKEDQEMKEEFKRRELAVSIVRDELGPHSMCDLFTVAERVGGDVDDEWVERILNAAGVIGKKGGTMTMVTSMGWAVRVTEHDMARLYITAAENGTGDEDGRIEMDELAAILETTLRS